MLEEKVTRHDVVYSNSHYTVQVVKYEEMPAAIYGVVNNQTNVIEGLQPTLPSAILNADELRKELLTDDPKGEPVQLDLLRDDPTH